MERRLSDTHNKKIKKMDSNTLMTAFMSKKNTSDEYNVAIIENGAIYHAISHH